MSKFKIIPTLSSIIARVLNPVLKPWDAFLIRSHAKATKYFPVFIVGAPRTGSTILYQTITNYFDVLYTDNVVNHFYRTFFLAFKISNFFYGTKAHNSSESYLGQTYASGMHGPSECSGFWYRWLSTGKHYIEKGEIDMHSIHEIRNNIHAVSNYFKKHIVFKNLNNGQRLELINEVDKQSRFIFISRDPFFTVQSILLARRKIGYPKNKMFGVYPKNFKELEKYDEIEMVVRQVLNLEAEIKKSLSLFPKENIINIQYNLFCENPEKYLELIQNRFFNGSVSAKKNATKPKIKFSETVRLNDAEVLKVKELLKILKEE